jgi:hypothetical protein
LAGLATGGLPAARIGFDDVFEMLTKSLRKNFAYLAPRRETPAKPGGKPNDPITAATLYHRGDAATKGSMSVAISIGSLGTTPRNPAA